MKKKFKNISKTARLVNGRVIKPGAVVEVEITKDKKFTSKQFAEDSKASGGEK